MKQIHISECNRQTRCLTIDGKIITINHCILTPSDTECEPNLSNSFFTEENFLGDEISF